ncbi:hypothetical protein PUN28_010546 [Cardiocondyla obscurior]|uniref:Uncharacterized protein n=1 Tax=Cardiocondyla obscurior TaxID=286306 RepID=A0AAW2FJV4_9HYME
MRYLTVPKKYDFVPNVSCESDRVCFVPMRADPLMYLTRLNYSPRRPSVCRRQYIAKRGPRGPLPRKKLARRRPEGCRETAGRQSVRGTKGVAIMKRRGLLSATFSRRVYTAVFSACPRLPEKWPVFSFLILRIKVFLFEKKMCGFHQRLLIIILFALLLFYVFICILYYFMFVT